MPIIQNDKIIFNSEDILNGLHPQYTASVSNIQKLGNFLAAARAFNPYRNYGYASPAYQPTDLTNIAAVDAIQVDVAVSETKAYTIGGTKLQEITILTDTITNAGNFPHTITGATAGQSLAIYKSNINGSLVNFLFYSWKDASNGNIGVYSLDEDIGWLDYDAESAAFTVGAVVTGGSSGHTATIVFIDDNGTTGTLGLSNATGVFENNENITDSATGDATANGTLSYFKDDFLSTVPASGATLDSKNDHPIIVGADGLLYIGDANNLHAFDGYTGDNGTLSKNTLDLPPNYVITSFAKLSVDTKTLSIFAHTISSGDTFNYGRATAFLWDYLNETYYNLIELNDNFVRAGFEYQGTIGCFTEGRTIDKANSGMDCKLQLYNGNGQFQVVANYIGSTPVNGGVDVIGNSIQWNTKGQIYSYRNNFDNKDAINFLSEGGSTGSNNNNGLLRTLSSVLQIVSTGASTGKGLQKLNSNYYFQSYFSTTLAKPNFPDGKIGKIRKVKVKYAKTATGGRGISVDLYDRSGLIVEVVQQEKVITAKEVMYYQDASGGFFSTFDDLKCVVAWDAGSGATDAPVLDSVEVYYKLKNISI